MFSVPRFIGGLAAAGLSAIVAMPTAVHAANSVGYSDPLCSAFYIDPASPPGAQTLKCAKLACSIGTTQGSYIQPVNTPITLSVSCSNPMQSALTYKWKISPQSPSATCPAPQSGLDTGQTLVVTATQASNPACWYEAVVTDSSGNTGWARYGLKWQ